MRKKQEEKETSGVTERPVAEADVGGAKIVDLLLGWVCVGGGTNTDSNKT